MLQSQGAQHVQVTSMSAVVCNVVDAFQLEGAGVQA